MAMTINPPDVYGHVLKKIFSGQINPGSRLVERQLADELGVSRVPVRETLLRLVAQGVLVGGDRGQGVCLRRYTPTEVRHLFQFREIVEGGAAYCAAQSRSEDDLAALDMICDQLQAQQNLDNPDVLIWGKLDHKFHQALAQASRQERFIGQMKTLLAEAHFVFFNLEPALSNKLSEPAYQLMARVSKEHQKIVDMVRSQDAESAEKAARTHIRPLADRATRSRIESGLTDYQIPQQEQQKERELEYA